MMKLNLFKIFLFALFLFIPCMKVNAEDYSDIYSRITKDGTLHINSFEPTNWKELDAIVQTEATRLIKQSNYSITTNLYDNISNSIPFEKNADGSYSVDIELGIWNKTFNYTHENHNIKVYIDSSNINPNIKEMVDQIANNIQSDTYYVEDLGLINLLSSYNFEDEGILESYLNKCLPYSTKYRDIVKNNDIEAIVSNLLGTSDPYITASGGDLVLFYNGVAYSYVPNIEVLLKNIIYIPSNTENTNDAYMEAALKRIKSYLGRDDITIQTYKEISSIVDNADYIEGVSAQQDYIDKQFVLDQIYNGFNNKLDMIYKLTFDNNEFYIMIEKNDDKLYTPIMNIKDNNSELKIESNELIPYDTKFIVNSITEDNYAYSKIKEKIGNNFIAYDIKLYSSLRGEDVSRGKFKISIPIPSILANKNLIVYYIDDNGDLEEHVIEIVDGYAVFETNHLSTYILTEKITSSEYAVSSSDKENNTILKNITTDNPKTVDNVYKNLLMFIGSIISLYIIKRFKKIYANV